MNQAGQAAIGLAAQYFGVGYGGGGGGDVSGGYDFGSTITTGPVRFGSTSSGGGTVVFGTSSPGLTAAASNITSNPWLLAGAGAVLLVGLFIYVRYGRK